MNVQVAVAVIGGFFALASTAVTTLFAKQGGGNGSSEAEASEPRRPPWLIVVAVVGAAVAGAFGWAAITADEDPEVSTTGPSTTTTTTAADAAPPEADIQIDSEGTFAKCQRLTGTGTIPEGTELWFVVETSDRDRYLASKPATRESNDSWEVEVGAFALGEGEPGEVGQSWLVYALLIDRETSEYLQSMKVLIDGEARFVVTDVYPFSDKLPPHVGDPAKANLIRNAELNC